MEVKIPYGKDYKVIEISDSNLKGIYYPNEVKKTDFDNKINSVMEKENIDSFLDTEEDIIIIVNDGTRPTPTKQVIKSIYAKIKDKTVKVIVATGAHRGATEEEYKYILGEEVYFDLKIKNAVFSHDSKNDEMKYLGVSKNGTEMYINKKVAEAKKVIVIGSVEPHYFAGYTGGRKGFLPGVAAYKTITQNHKLALEEDAKALRLEGNPVHEDMMDAMGVLKDIDVFAIMTVLDRDHDVYEITAGNLETSFYAAIEKANEVFCVDIEKKADIVVTAAPYPMDIDLYQSQKAIDNGKLVLKDNGILIFVSECRDGIGGKTFFELMSSCKTPDEVLSKIKKEYKLGYHKAGKLAEICKWAEIWGVTGLTDEELRAIHMIPKKNLQEALLEAIKIKGKDASVVVLPYGSLTVPKVSQEGGNV